jgi:hypothetical protein
MAAALEAIPERLLPVRGQSMHLKGNFYNNLKGLSLTPHEKHFILGEIDGTHALLEPTGFDEDGEELRTGSGFALRYGLKNKSISA